MTGSRSWSTGDTVSAADFVSYISSQVLTVFSTATARDAAITSPSEGMFSYTITTPEETLSYYDGSSWVATSLTADITGITTASNSSMAGGATSGAPSLSVSVTNSTSATAVAADYVLISDTNDSNATKKALISDITSLNAATATLAATATALATGRNIGGVSFDGTAAIVPNTITVADTTDTTCSVALFESATGDLAPKTDGGATYNAGTGTLTATAFAGPLTGNVTGNASGTALTVTQAAQSAITSVGTLSALDVTGAITAGSLVAPLAINAQTGTTYTFVLADAGKMVTSSNGSAQTVTVPPNSSVAFDVGTQIIVQNIGSANATLAQGAGVTINSKDSNKEIDGQFAAATLIKTATDAWSLIGALA
jgi:hypothetical protein